MREEYHPFGTTSWWATNGSTDVSAKRYRYTGKERDDETGLGFHGARYYAAWLGRWERPDPIGLKGGINPYRYASNDPIGRSDPSGMADMGQDPEPDWGICRLPGQTFDPDQPSMSALDEPAAPPAAAPADHSTLINVGLAVLPHGPAGRGAMDLGLLAGSIESHNDPHHDEKVLMLALGMATMLDGSLPVGSGAVRAVAHNEPISTRLIAGVEGVPTIMAQGPSAEAGAQLRHFAEGQGFSMAVDPRNKEWVAIATGSREAPDAAVLRSGQTFPAADQRGTHLEGASALARRPVSLPEARSGSTGFFGGAVVMRGENTVEIGLTSGVLNTGYVHAPPGRPVPRELPMEGPEADLLREIFTGMGFRVVTPE